MTSDLVTDEMAPLATLGYRDRAQGRVAGRFFNSAFIGFEPEKARTVASDESVEWPEALDRVKARYTRLMGLTREHHTVFYNTTAGVQRIILRLTHILDGQPATLLTTDMEYPGIMSLLDEHWHGRLVIAQVGNEVWRGRAEKVSKLLREAVLLVEPDVIYVSHIARATGYRVSESVIDFARTVNPRVVIALDGAQAVGNIAVSESLLRKVDFYVTSGHKWLSGREPLGVVTAEPAWKLPDPAQSYSRKEGSGGTGNLQCLRSLGETLKDFVDEPSRKARALRKSKIARIEEWNRVRAWEFTTLLRERRVPVQVVSRKWPEWARSGIVTVSGGSEEISAALSVPERTKRIEYTRLEDEAWVSHEGAPGPGERFLLAPPDEGRPPDITRGSLRQDRWGPPMPQDGASRFCFHYCHTKKHVVELVDRIEAAFKRRRASRASSRSSTKRGEFRGRRRGVS